MGVYKVKYGQTIYDIAVQEYGGISGVSQILLDNTSINLDTVLEPESEIIITQNSDTVDSVDIYNYFKEKTITSTESTLNELDTTSYVGTIITNEQNPTSFINNNVWGSDSELRFSNQDLDTLTYVSMNRYISFASPDDFLDIEFTYDNSVTDQVVVGSDTNASLSISSGELSLYADGGIFIAKAPFTITNGSNTSVSIVSTVNIVGNTVTKGIDFIVNNKVISVLDLGGQEINFKSFAGVLGRVGLNGTIGKININGDIFRLVEGSGKNIFKTI